MWDLLMSVLVWLLQIALVLVIVAGGSLVIYARWNYGTLEKLGIPVVKPHWILGSNYNAHKIYPQIEDLNRSLKYGHVYGVYEGRSPQIFISDTKIIRKILTTDFEHFRNHRKFPFENEVTQELLDLLDDEKWKTIRAVLSPQFTTAKIKQMCETVRELSEEYVTALVKDMNGEKRMTMDFRKYCPPLILELIGKCLCGINIENARDPNNKFIEILKEAVGGDFMIVLDWKFTLTTVLPFLTKLSPIFPNESIDSFVKTMRGILKGREQSKIEKQDMVNTLLEIFKKAKTDADYKRLGITEITALSQAYEFFIASYEGIRTSLSFFTYFMATNPEVQEKLLKEIDSSLAKHGGKINYDTCGEMPYLQACFSEVLRIQPAFFRPDRICTQDWEFNGLKIKKGMTVIIPTYALHKHPDYYSTPDQFYPERFMPGQKENLDPYAFGSFGHGPRACIGQRFVTEMFKIVICHFMKEFTIEKRADTVLKIAIGNPVMTQYDPILVDFNRRN